MGIGKIKNKSSSMLRSSKEFKMLINKIKIEYLKKNKKPPSSEIITKRIAKILNEEDILFNEFVKLN